MSFSTTAEHKEPFSVSAIVPLANVLFFVVVQTAFFWFVASREVDRTLKRKAEILRILRKQFAAQGVTEAVDGLDAVMLKHANNSARPAAEAKATRTAANLKLIVQWIVPVGVLVTLALVVCVSRNRSEGHHFNLGNRVGLGLVLFVYVFEILFFLLVVEN